MTTETQQHTPGPWRAEWLDDLDGWIMDGAGNYLATIVTEDDDGFLVPAAEQEANARFIVQACNSFEELLAAAKLSLEELEYLHKRLGLSPCAASVDLRKAIAKATSPQAR